MFLSFSIAVVARLTGTHNNVVRTAPTTVLEFFIMISTFVLTKFFSTAPKGQLVQTLSNGRAVNETTYSKGRSPFFENFSRVSKSHVWRKGFY